LWGISSATTRQMRRPPLLYYDFFCLTVALLLLVLSCRVVLLLLDPADAVSSNVSSTVLLTSIVERADPPPSAPTRTSVAHRPPAEPLKRVFLPLYSNNGCERSGPALLYLKAFRFQRSPPRVFIRYSIPPHYSIFSFPLSIILLAFNPRLCL
jgi:hypothetical protein